ncbi:MAG: DUF4437 domain-containing protein [Phycisphaerales bacterium JB052]
MNTHHATIKLSLSLIAIASVLSACSSSQTVEDQAGVAHYESLSYKDIQWGALNPARGDNSPRAGNLWGDRTGPGASGFLVQFVDGFSSPPHIHNITYRGVVINGLVHNDDPNAEEMWLPSGSFWTQPAGDTHITAAQGQFNLAYIEIDEGPYLVKPTSEAFPSADVSINVDESNLVWLDASSISWVDLPNHGGAASGTKIAWLWGDPQDDQPSGSLVQLPAGFQGEIRSHAPSFHAVVIQGTVTLHGDNTAGWTELEPGSYFGRAQNPNTPIAVSAHHQVMLYIRTDGRYEITANSEAP